MSHRLLSPVALLCFALGSFTVACGDDDTLSNNAAGSSGSAGSAGNAGSAGSSGSSGSSGTAGTTAGEDVEVTEDISADTTWTANNVYHLSKLTKVKSGATLTIEPGTLIKAQSSESSPAALIVMQGAKINAAGTKDKPIVFTSGADSRKPGDWGGVMLNGKAKINRPGGTATPEGLEGAEVVYGGTDDEDDSGVLSYVRIEFAGYELSPDNELNGLTLNAVGSKTTVDHIQVHFGTDDGIECFGGTVNIKYAMVSGCQDDGLDWDSGWRGKVQFLAVVQDDLVKGDNGFEADNLKDDTTAEPFSNPVISNVTLIGKKVSGAEGSGMLLRRGTKGEISNALVVGFAKWGLNVDGAQTGTNATDGSLSVTNSIFACDANFANGAEDDDAMNGDNGFLEPDWALTESSNNQELSAADVAITAVGIESPNLALKSGSKALTGASVPDDAFFDKVEFIGACGSSCEEFAGWTSFPVE